VNLYLISQNVNNGYDTYDSAVVRAESEDAARRIHPDSEVMSKYWDGCTDKWGDWANAADVKVELLGTALEGSLPGVVCASFNAG
jgi:hypothetical protein